MAGIKGIKTALIALAVMLCSVLLTGCGASLTVSSYTENGTLYNSYELAIDRDTVEKMEASAIADADGVPYNVPDYFFGLFRGLGCELVDAGYNDEAFVARYRRAFSDESQKAERPAQFVTGVYLRDIAEQLTAEYEFTENPFVRNYTAKMPDPFNGVRAAYDAVKPNQSTTPIQRLKNGDVTLDGVTGEVTVLLPPVTEAFPYLKSLDPDGLLLNYVHIGSSRMTSSGRAYRLNATNSAYVFSRYFDDAEATIEFNYDRPVIYGWYIVAVLAGGIVIAAFLLATRKKKPKTTLLDRFPYNPEEYRDYDSHLPSV